MGFFKGLKEDFSQAMNELLPEEELFEEELSKTLEENDKVEQSESEQILDNVEIKAEKGGGEKHKTRDIQEILEEEVKAALNALNIEEDKNIAMPEDEEIPEEVVMLEEVFDTTDEEDEEDAGMTEEEIIQRMIDEDERKLREAEEKNIIETKEDIVQIPEDLVEDSIENEMEEQQMADFTQKEELEEASDMELIAKLLGEDSEDEIEEAFDDALLVEDKDDKVTKEEETLEPEEERILGDDVTVITKGTKINGSISSDGSLEIMGTINGDIDCLGKLSIVGNVAGNSQASEIYVNAARLDGSLTSTGSVKVGVGTIVVGDIKSQSAVIAGAVKGEVDVNGPVIIDSTAIVKGNINAKSVQINNGAVIDGYCSLSYASVDIDNFFDGEK